MSTMPGCPVPLCLTRDGYLCGLCGCHALHICRWLSDGQPHALAGVSDATLAKLAAEGLVVRGRTGRPVWATPHGRRLGKRERAA